MGLASLTNGPVGILIPALIVCLYLTFSCRWERVLALKPFSGTLVFIAVTVPWLIFVVWKTSGRWADTLVLPLRYMRYMGRHGPGHQFFSILLAPVHQSILRANLNDQA
jgi:4-amino-4-deoxy-L-arabinose transferase-like glycosyltransferase